MKTKWKHQTFRVTGNSEFEVRKDTYAELIQNMGQRVHTSERLTQLGCGLIYHSH